MKESKRQRQIGEMIQRDLARILLLHPEQPLFAKITIISVMVAPDLSIAKVYFSVFDEAQVKEANEVLKKSGGFLRHELARSLNLRITPQLRFVYDESIRRGQHLSALIEEAVARDEELHHDESGIEEHHEA